MGERNFKITPRKEPNTMPLIMPIKDLRNTSEISEIAHKEQEPIFITKNGYSDLVVMSSELYDRFARINRIDQAIYESEKEMQEGGEAIDLEDDTMTVYIVTVQYQGRNL
jgi:prevent-host-death family protein